MERSTLILIQAHVVAGCLFILFVIACAPSAAGSDSGERNSPTVVYVSSTAGTWEDGIANSSLSCAVGLPDGRTDYRGCCPPGYLPVGTGPSGLACLAK